jgi:gliding motility-associated-like protein
METCDDDSNNGIASFDIASQTNTILGDQSPDEFSVTYHVGTTDATNGENALDPLFTGSDGQVIWARVENNATGCFSLTDFTLIVNPHPFMLPPLVECDLNYDGITTFNLTDTENDLFVTPNPDNIITYFESLEDLQSDTDPILNKENYINVTNPQTIYIKVYNTVADCFSYVPLELDVSLPPAINEFEVFDICENDTNSFDLTRINDVITNNAFNVLFSYYKSETDAIANENSIDTNYTYTSTNDIIYARVTYSTTQCYFVYPFELNVNPLPTANQPQDLIACDDDFDGLMEFDLTQQTSTILGNQNPNNFRVTYYNDTLLGEEGIEAINPNPYIAFNGEIITARVENIITGCYNLVTFSTIINPRPFVNIPDQVVCLDNLPLVVTAETFTNSDTYLWSTNATTPEIEITEIGTYSVTVTSEFGCVTTSTFNVIESESATIDLTETVDFSDPNNIVITISGIGNYLYILDDGEPQESNVFENVALGYHTITIIDLNGCAEVTKEVLVIDAPKFFTPNNDAQNDTWHIIGIETLPGSIIYVFDRYGKLLKQLDSTTPGWDGRYNGNNMPASDYWFLAEIRQGNLAFEVRGHFTLRR